MLNKTNSILKYSFFAVSLAYLLNSTALAQNKLSLLDEDAPAVKLDIDKNNEDDELNFSLDDELAPPTVNSKVNSKKDTLSPDAKAPIRPQKPIGKLGMKPQEKAPIKPISKEQKDPLIKAYNNFADEEDKRAFNAPAPKPTGSLGDGIMNQVKEDLFSQMADIEKQTSLLTLELKREEIKNKIAAIKAQRQKAVDEEFAKQKELERKQAEWEKAQERKLLEEQQKLKDLEIKYEKLRQERVLKAYKESMLKSNQEWVDYNSRLYNQLVKEEKTQADLIAKQKEYFKNLSAEILKANKAAQTAKEKYNTEIANLQTQVAILKSKLEAEKNAFEESKKTGPNPFALVDDENAPKIKLSEEYAIMEISGQGEQLIAKLINKKGGTFMVKPGTILNTGHVIEDITQTYISADKSGVKDYLYFSAGGILDKEPTDPISKSVMPMEPEREPKRTISSRVPSLREGMFVE